MERLTISDAAKLLGITEAAIRQRIRRGTIEYQKLDGRTYVYVDPHETANDTVEDKSRDTLLFRSMQDQIDTLKHELAIRNEELRRKDHIIAALTERIPAIEPPAEEPPDAPESSVTASEEEGKGQAPPEPETAAYEPWWRRIFR